MSRLGKEAEQRLVRGLENALDLVAGGMSPTDAVVKVAADDRLPPRDVRLLVNAYNTGRTTRQRASGSGPFGKAASFPLADAAAVLAALYPPEVKSAAAREAAESAVSSEYDRAPDWLDDREKRARLAADPGFDAAPPEYPRDPARFEARVDGGRQKLAVARDELAALAGGAHDRVSSAFGDLVDYFRTPGHLPFDDVRLQGEAAFGPAAGPLFAKLAAALTPPPLRVSLDRPEEEEAGEGGEGRRRSKRPLRVRRIVATPMRRRETPYKEVEACLHAAAEYAGLMDRLAAFEKEAARLDLALAHSGRDVEPLPADPTLSLTRRLRGEKRAGLSDTVGKGLEFGLGAQAGSSIMKRIMPKTDDKLKEDAYLDVLDPSHEAKLRGIRAQATLHGLLSSPYFEGEDPRQVADLFNRVVKLSPRLADQPLALEAVMRRYTAQGQADPHDLDQLLGLETKMKQRDEPSRRVSMPGTEGRPAGGDGRDD